MLRGSLQARAGFFAFGLAAAGLMACSHGPQTEVGTPAHPYRGLALVVLPRACISDHAAPRGNVLERSSPRRTEVDAETVPPAKTARLQALLDGIGPGAPMPLGPRPDGACDVPAGSDLEDVRATDEMVRGMRQRGASYAVVLELQTELACSEHKPWSTNDACMEDQVTLSAWMFDAQGAAIWALTRKVGPTDEPTAAIDRVLERVPTAERLRRMRGEYEIGRSAAPPTDSGDRRSKKSASPAPADLLGREVADPELIELRGNDLARR